MKNDNVGKCGHVECAGGNGCMRTGKPMSEYDKNRFVKYTIWDIENSLDYGEGETYTREQARDFLETAYYYDMINEGESTTIDNLDEFLTDAHLELRERLASHWLCGNCGTQFPVNFKGMDNDRCPNCKIMVD